MNLKEIANAFDMSVYDFAKCTGYTMQSLYCKPSVRKTARAKATISLLKFLNDSMTQQEMENVRQRALERRKAIEEFRMWLLGDGDGNGN